MKRFFLDPDHDLNSYMLFLWSFYGKPIKDSAM